MSQQNDTELWDLIQDSPADEAEAPGLLSAVQQTQQPLLRQVCVQQASPPLTTLSPISITQDSTHPMLLTPPALQIALQQA